VHWGDIALALDGFPGEDIDLSSGAFWDEWRERWAARGDSYVRLADESTTVAGRVRAFRGAAACYHWSEFMDFGDPARKLASRRRVRDCFQRSLEDGELDITPGELTVDGVVVPYWLLLPPRHRSPGPPPCVILSNGLDSMTEVEILELAEGYLERGIAAVLFDGPGQGILLGQTPLRIDMEHVVAALVARIRQDGRIDPGALGFAGISFGGYFALRVARALGASFRCVVNYSGGPRVAPYEGLPRRLKEDFRFAFQGGGDLDMQARFDALAIGDGTAPATDVLSVHGALDDIFPLAALAELDQAWGSRHQLITHAREAHVCLNQINACTLEAADWAAGRLLSP